MFSFNPQTVTEKGTIMNIYIGNLPFSKTGDDLKAMFSEFGEVQESKVIMDGQTKRSKGFGFVEMPNNSEADKAIKSLNGKFIDGQNIKVNPADPGGKKAKKSSFRRR